MIRLAVPLRYQSLTEPCASVVGINDLSLEEALICQLAVIEPEVEETQIGPSHRVLHRLVSTLTWWGAASDSCAHLCVQLQ
jgi:hypothetical protein